MRPLPLPSALAALLLVAGVPAAAQETPTTSPSASARPTKVVARSGRLVTARTADGSTRSFNCKKPDNRSRPVCRH